MDAFVPVEESYWQWEDNPDPDNAEYERGWFVFHDEGSNWHFYINTGRGFKSYKQSLFPLGADSAKEGDWGGPYEIFAIDVNHDGLSIIRVSQCTSMSTERYPLPVAPSSRQALSDRSH